MGLDDTDTHMRGGSTIQPDTPTPSPTHIRRTFPFPFHPGLYGLYGLYRLYGLGGPHLHHYIVTAAVVHQAPALQEGRHLDLREQEGKHGVVTSCRGHVHVEGTAGSKGKGGSAM